jgi:GT2 family glycosyltransferase
LNLSIIIVNWNTKRLLIACLTSVFETVRGIDFEVWVVDNASVDGSAAAVAEKYPDAHVIRNSENIGFAAANNLAFRKMTGWYALLLNTDTILTKNAINTLYDFMEKNPKAGMACGQLLNRDGTKQNSMANFPSLPSLVANETVLRMLFPRQFPSKRSEYFRPIEIDSCIGACMIVRKKAIDQVGLLDEQYFFFFEETDWAYRMKLSGWKVWFVPMAEIYHLQGQSIGHNVPSRIMFYRSRYIYFKKWYPRIYPFLFIVTFSKLLANSLLALLGLLVTFGLKGGFRNKLITYIWLIGWHLKGCP